MNAARSAPTGPRRRWFPKGADRTVIIAACVIAIVCILVGGHLYGRYLSARDMAGRDGVIAQLGAQNQSYKRQLDEKSAQITGLETKLDKAQAELHAIMPAVNTYGIDPNQSLVVGEGHLTIGLVGSPGNDSVSLTINGKPQVVAAGQTIDIAPDPSTSCQVKVQSFDMFKAVVTASCTAGKSP